MPETFKTREEWFTAAIERHFRPLFEAVGAVIPKVRVSCGWPSKGGISKTKTVWGQCWHGKASEDGSRQIFVNPRTSDPVFALNILGHELVHAALPDGTKHGAPFTRLCDSIGWKSGKAATRLAGPEAEEGLKQLATVLGEYPHSAIGLTTKDTEPKASRQIKLLCPANEKHDKDIIIRSARAQLRDFGLPSCPCGREFLVEGGLQVLNEEPKEESEES